VATQSTGQHPSGMCSQVRTHKLCNLWGSMKTHGNADDLLVNLPIVGDKGCVDAVGQHADKSIACQPEYASLLCCGSSVDPFSTAHFCDAFVASAVCDVDSI
jgi:hypothetical protein